MLLIKPAKEMFTPHFPQSVQWTKGLVREHNSSSGLVAKKLDFDHVCNLHGYRKQERMKIEQSVRKPTKSATLPGALSFSLANLKNKFQEIVELGPTKHHPNPEMECNMVICAGRRVSYFLLMNMVHFQIFILLISARNRGCPQISYVNSWRIQQE